MVEQWITDSKAADSNPLGRQLFRIPFLSSRGSDGSSLDFRAGGQIARKRLGIQTLASQNVKTSQLY